MIYTLTLNPAIDYVIRIENFEEGYLNRSVSEEIQIGGKGINVSLVLKELGLTSTTLGFISGFTGEEIRARIIKKGILTDFVTLEEGNSRINIKLKTEAETEINASGPDIPDWAAERLLSEFDKLSCGDILVISGSVPKNCPKNIYEKILARLENKKVLTCLDFTGENLLECLKYKPFLIKPNNFELGELFGAQIKEVEEALSYAQKLKQMGAQNILVSFAEKGAVLLDENGNITKISAPKGKILNSTGAGDSMVAAFLAGYIKSKDYTYALKLGAAAGSATAFSVGLAEKEKIEEIFSAL